MKKCSQCGEIKETSLFTANKNSKEGRERSCKSCAVLRSKLWTAANKEKSNARKKEWVNRNKEKVKASKQKYEALNKELVKISKNLWNTNNKAHRNSLCRKYQAAKLNRTPLWTTEEDIKYMRCLYQLAEMRSKYSDQKWHVDHIIPLQGKTVSGFHVPSNLQVIPASDNSRKGNKYENWFIRKH